MHVLALDTTTRGGSVALVDEHRIIDVRPGDASRSQAERLPGELLELAAAHHVPLDAIDLFAIASGPGSFTGLRIGIATIQGLALTTGRRIAAVSALEALAHTVAADAPPGTFVAAWMDARRHDVFAALYRVREAPPFSAARLIEIEAPTAGHPEATIDRWNPLIGGARAVCTGDGALLYADTIRSRAARWEVVSETPLIAGTLGRIAAARAPTGDTVGPAGVQPVYVRRPDVEIERERRAVADAS
jgi:tRNA threonylcarbamoyladenosine biosynthesis protein TsaB